MLKSLNFPGQTLTRFLISATSLLSGKTVGESKQWEDWRNIGSTGERGRESGGRGEREGRKRIIIVIMYFLLFLDIVHMTVKLILLVLIVGLWDPRNPEISMWLSFLLETLHIPRGYGNVQLSSTPSSGTPLTLSFFSLPPSPFLPSALPSLSLSFFLSLSLSSFLSSLFFFYLPLSLSPLSRSSLPSFLSCSCIPNYCF